MVGYTRPTNSRVGWSGHQLCRSPSRVDHMQRRRAVGHTAAPPVWVQLYASGALAIPVEPVRPAGSSQSPPWRIHATRRERWYLPVTDITRTHTQPPRAHRHRYIHTHTPPPRTHSHLSLQQHQCGRQRSSSSATGGPGGKPLASMGRRLRSSPPEEVFTCLITRAVC